MRSQVLAAATRLFASRGFEGTSIQSIADECGVSKPAVLHHFPSKEDLRRAVLEVILDHWRDVLPRLLLAATASQDRFDAVFGELFRFFAADPDRARLVVREVMDRPAEVKKLLRGPVRPWLAAVAAYIDSGREHGRHWSDIDAEAYVVHILQLVLSATAASAVCRSVLEPEGESRGRYDRELARIARASLFQPATKETSTKPSPEGAPTPSTPAPPSAKRRGR
jgi:AcrR family transcriptional regulator